MRISIKIEFDGIDHVLGFDHSPQIEDCEEWLCKQMTWIVKACLIQYSTLIQKENKFDCQISLREKCEDE